MAVRWHISYAYNRIQFHMSLKMSALYPGLHSPPSCPKVPPQAAFHPPLRLRPPGVCCRRSCPRNPHPVPADLGLPALPAPVLQADLRLLTVLSLQAPLLLPNLPAVLVLSVPPAALLLPRLPALQAALLFPLLQAVP